MSTPSDSPDPRPLSRREAREAAARADAGTPETDAADAAAHRVVAAPAVPGAAAAAARDAEPAGADLSDTAETDGRASRRADAVAADNERRLTDMDALFAQPAASATKSRRGAKRGRGCLIALLIFAVILGGIGAAGVWAWNTYGPQIQELLGLGEPTDFEAGLDGEETTITIADGDGGSAVSAQMFQAGVTKTESAFYDYLVDSGKEPTFYAGVYRLRTNLPASEALTMLEDPANRLENALLIREGETAAQIYADLAATLEVPVDEVVAAAADPSVYGVSADSLEGWLFPATYDLQQGTTPQAAIQLLVDRMKQSLEEHGVAAEDANRVLTIASIIQREARFSQDFYKVARVIENRLQPDNTETFGLLQMDSTAQYGVGQLKDGSVGSTDEALTDDNPWNTYVHPGLPIGPIASPGDLAIDAALHPADGPWLYFVTVNLDTGETKFTTTLAEHNAAREEWISWCAENPDSGC